MPANGPARSPRPCQTWPPAAMSALPPTITRHASRSPVAWATRLARLQPPELEADIGPAGALRRHAMHQAAGVRARGGAAAARSCRGLPGVDQPAIAGGHRPDRLLVVDPPGQPVLGRRAEDGAADGEALADRMPPRHRERGHQLVLRGVEAEQQHAAAVRVVGGDGGRDRAPRPRRCRGAAASTSRDRPRARRSGAMARASVRSSTGASDLPGITSSSRSWPVRRQASARISTCRSCSAHSSAGSSGW